MDVTALRRGLLGVMAGGQQYEIITVQTTFNRATPGFPDNFAPHADPTDINYFVRLDADLDDNTTEVVIYVDGTLKGAVRKRDGTYGFLATPGTAHDCRAEAGDRYAKIVQEEA